MSATASHVSAARASPCALFRKHWTRDRYKTKHDSITQRARSWRAIESSSSAPSIERLLSSVRLINLGSERALGQEEGAGAVVLVDDAGFGVFAHALHFLLRLAQHRHALLVLLLQVSQLQPTEQ